MFSAFWRESWNKQICVNKENDPTWYLKIELIEVFLLEGFSRLFKNNFSESQKAARSKTVASPPGNNNYLLFPFTHFWPTQMQENIKCYRKLQKKSVDHYTYILHYFENSEY